MATSGIFNQYMSAAQSAGSNTAQVTGTAQTGATSSTSTSDSASDITANDFLTLLVTEMQNQDPTADTDPNEYINQLVNVNSLEQLININQTLTSAYGSSSSSSTTTGASASGAQSATATTAGSALSALQPAGSTTPTSGTGASTLQQVAGNLSVPSATTASQAVARSLNGQSPARSIAGLQSTTN
jgi:flagellar basal-body rod modification protein FlgD